MVLRRLNADLNAELDRLRANGTYKSFHTLSSPQDTVVEMDGVGEVLVLSSNNYLGLANDPDVVAAGIDGLRRYGAGTSSVRFICGTFEPHLELEHELADLVGTEAALTYVSCWNANEAVIPSLADDATAVFSDEFNHASIIDAIRLAKSERKVVYAHSDMGELEAGLRACDPEQRKLIITDGVFSMEGDLARLPDIVDLARRYEAIVIVDDSHGTGVMGATGRGVAEHFGLLGEVDVITSTLGKALGGAAGGFVASSGAVCDVLAQRSRPQVFSNALPPTVAASACAAVRAVKKRPGLVERLREHSRYFRRRLRELGFAPLAGESGIIPVVLGDTAAAIRYSEALLQRGVFVTGFGYPVVPEGSARIRVQMSAALTPAQLDRALDALHATARDVGIL